MERRLRRISVCEADRSVYAAARTVSEKPGSGPLGGREGITPLLRRRYYYRGCIPYRAITSVFSGQGADTAASTYRRQRIRSFQGVSATFFQTGSTRLPPAECAPFFCTAFAIAGMLQVVKRKIIKPVDLSQTIPL